MAMTLSTVPWLSSGVVTGGARTPLASLSHLTGRRPTTTITFNGVTARSVPLPNSYSLSSTFSENNNGRPIAQFHPSHWGNLFLDYTPHDQETRTMKANEIDELKQEVKKELSKSAEKTTEREFELIDTIERLGIAYHFEEELEQILQRIFHTYSATDINDAFENEDLYHTSLRFRVLRQHGFFISSGIFNKFMDKTGNFKECLKNDVEGILSLYEASHVRIHGEDLLDEAFAFTKMHLSAIVDSLSGTTKVKVNHALKQSLHRGMTRLESRHYISFYESDPLHDKTLLKLAKLDFNFLLSLHKTEYKDIARWWNEILSSYKFARDRLTELYFWSLGVAYEPQYSIVRKMFCKMSCLVTIIDDIYDAYGQYEELELLTEAIHRWDRSYTNELPDYMKFVYESLLSTFEEFQQDLAKDGRSHLLHYYKDQTKTLCDSYLQEAKWRTQKKIPTYEEYIKNGEISFSYGVVIAGCFLGMGKLGTQEALEWAKLRPKCVTATCIISRLKNDMGGDEFQQCRDHVASAVECYMKEKGVHEDEAREALNKQVENAWKDLNEGMLRPHAIAWPLLSRILQLSRALDVFYNGEDGYTNVSQTMRDKIELVLIHEVVL